jgi:hypothetical protein
VQFVEHIRTRGTLSPQETSHGTEREGDIGIAPESALSDSLRTDAGTEDLAAMADDNLGYRSRRR